jgi:TonB family protein
MSGESVLAFFKKTKSDPYQERFEVENDRRLFGCMGSGSVFGTVLAVYALSIQIIIPPFQGGHDPEKPEPPLWPRKPPGDETIRIRPPADYHGSLRARRTVKVHPGPAEANPQAPQPHTRKPALKEPGVLGVNVIGSKGGLSALRAYDLLPKAMRNVDLDKLDEVGTLTRTEGTRLTGRLGMQGNAYNEAYYTDGTGKGPGDGIVLPGLPKTRIPGTIREPEAIGKPIEIDQFQNTTSRSTASILAVIRSRSPGLRHLYNMHLKMRPGLAGKVTLRFAIAPSGQVVDVGLAGSTTDAPDFDAQVEEKVMSWRFEPVKAIGNDMVTVPFNFSE